MRNLMFWSSLLLAGSAFGQTGQYSFSVIPASPIAGQEFQIRVNLSNLGCVPLPSTLPASPLGNNVIRYELYVPDSCFPFPQQEQTYAVQALPAGQYTFRFAICPQPIPPPQGSTCSTLSEQTITVAGSASPSVIPSLSWWGLSMLTCIAALFGLVAMRRAWGMGLANPCSWGIRRERFSMAARQSAATP